MSAYLIEVHDSKQGVCYPDVIGPFPGAEDARRFADEMDMGRYAEWSGEGGYSEVHVIAPSTCDYSPEEYRRDNEWRLPVTCPGCGNKHSSDEYCPRCKHDPDGGRAEGEAWMERSRIETEDTCPS